MIDDNLENLKEFLNFKRLLNQKFLSKIDEIFQKDFLYNSNAIEGNSMTKQETQVVLEYGVTIKGKTLDEHLEVRNQNYAIDFLINEVEVKEKTELSKFMIKEFHQIIIGDINRSEAGQWRKLNVEIGLSETKTTPHYLIDESIDKLIEWYNNQDKKNIIENIAIFHAEFEKIHPFYDGNGRTGRLIMNLELMKADYPITIIYNEDRLEYYNALEKAQTKKDYKDIINFVKNNVKRSIIRQLNLIDDNWEKEFEEFKRS